MKNCELIILMIFLFALAAWGQEADTSVALSSSDTLDTLVVDTTTVVKDDKEDSDDFDDFDDEALFAEAEAEAVGVTAGDSLQKLDIVRRDHNYRQQVKLAIVMMAFIIAALTTSQSWNPR